MNYGVIRRNGELTHQRAAVDTKALPGDIIRFTRCQEQDGVGDVLGTAALAFDATPPEGYLGLKRFQHGHRRQGSGGCSRQKAAFYLA